MIKPKAEGKTSLLQHRLGGRGGAGIDFKKVETLFLGLPEHLSLGAKPISELLIRPFGLGG